MVIGTVVSCQTPELVEDEPKFENGIGVYGRVPIMFTATIPSSGPVTKVMDHEPDIHSFHLVIFDENGMFVEVAQAELVGDAVMDENSREYKQKFKVVVTLSDQPRIIHFIANCPVDQIAYGHEASIIGNMYVENGETAYWSRAEVPHIQVVDKVYDTDTDNEHFHPCEHLIHHLEHVHLLRNFAEILVEDHTGDKDPFQLMGFSVYNTIDRGTVAPYNNKNQEFQCFVDEEEAAAGKEVIYDYDELMGLPFPYEGHALSSALLNQNMPKRDGKYIWYGPDLTNPSKEQEHFFMYERKVSVRTDEEDKWRESPPHVIVKAMYGNEICYYKFDLVYNIIGKDPEGNEIVTDIKYFHILRNFLYHFQIKNVHSPGYKTVEEAIAGITSNNLAGSTTTSGLKEVAVGLNRIAVSFTDTTIVNSGPIHFRYKYEPNYNEEGATPQNSSDYVKLLDADGETLADDGDVIASHAVAANDIRGGELGGFRDVVFNIKEPGDQIMEQVVTVKPQDYQLTRRIRINLRKKLKMTVECEPRIKSGINVEQYVKIRLQPGLTADMFPLHLSIETEDLSLSPDASKNSIPVVTGKSTIPSKNGKRSFYFDYVIESYDDYNNSELFPRDEDNYRIINTYWRTNCVDNASTVYVTNKYFDTENASDSWTNVRYAFSNVAVTTQNIPKGTDRDVAITFTKDASDNQQRQVTITLDGMTDANGNTTITRTIGSNARTVEINGLKTTSVDGKVGFTLDAADYRLASAISGERVGNRFENVGFNPGSVDIQAGIPVNYNFTIPAYYDGMEVNVTLDGLAPADDETRLEAPADGRSAIKSYVFRPTGAGVQTLKLKTQNKEESICYVTIEAENYYYETETTPLYQSAVRYSFEEAYFDGRPQSITANTDVKVIFNIPAGAFSKGMIVNVTLDGFGPNDNKLNDAGNGTYTYTVTQSGEQEFRVKASGKEARTCYVTLESINNKFITETIEVEQSTATYALKMTNISGSTNIYDTQVTYELATPLTNGATYTLTFRVRADKNITDNNNNDNFSIYLKKTSNNNDQYYPTVEGNITTGWTTKTITIRPNGTNFNLIAFNLGRLGNNSSVYIDNISLKQNNSNVELIENGDFETDNLQRWGIKTNGNTPKCSFERVPEGYEP